MRRMRVGRLENGARGGEAPAARLSSPKSEPKNPHPTLSRSTATIFMITISLHKQSSSPPNLPLVSCKEASHGRRTVQGTLPVDPTGSSASSSAETCRVHRWIDPAGGLLG